MNSFRLTAIGNLARNPELWTRDVATLARFCLTGTDEVSEGEGSEHPRSVTTSLWFVAFGDIATEILRHARKGDQLILEARVIANDWTEQGEKRQGHAFVVTGFRFGAKHGKPGAPAASCRAASPNTPPLPPAEAEVGGKTENEAARYV